MLLKRGVPWLKHLTINQMLNSCIDLAAREIAIQFLSNMLSINEAIAIVLTDNRPQHSMLDLLLRKFDFHPSPPTNFSNR